MKNQHLLAKNLRKTDYQKRTKQSKFDSNLNHIMPYDHRIKTKSYFCSLQTDSIDIYTVATSIQLTDINFD
jgi:hypothetical protein